MTSKIILDTHIWIWLINGDERLSSLKCLSAIEKFSKSDSILVSAISVWEVGMLESKGRITFPISCMDWINQSLSAPGIILTPLLPEIAIESTRLPGNFHGDPADRIIVATARKLKVAMVTADSKIKAYAKEGHLQLLR